VTELADLSIAELLHEFRSRRASPSEALESCLGRIERLDGRVNAVLTWLVERATTQARESTERWMTGEARPLEGVPYGLKDIIATAGVRSTGGSALYKDNVPAESATLAQRLDAAGAVLIAKLYTFEFAAGSNATTSNPWDLDRWACGSSSGPGAAVAAREMPLSVGTDTGGSIIGPAAFCGIVGVKPTFGRVPRTGIMPLCWTLDHAGPMTHSALDAALALGVMAGYDPKDPSSGRRPVDDYVGGIDANIKGVRIGLPTDWFYDICDPEVEAACKQAAHVLQDLGATVREVAMPATKVVHPHAIELTIIYAELASNHEINLERLDEYGPEFQKLFIRSQFTGADDYLRALRARHLLQLDFQNAFETVDALIVPGMLCTAPRHDHLVAKIGDTEYPLLDVASRPTAIMDEVGVPTVCFPVGFDSIQLPIGAQVAARPYDEALCFRLAHAYQQVTDFHKAVPPIVRDDAAVVLAGRSTESRPAILEKPIVTATKDSVW
jgi:aspartyl-tRNA(Asn)/glutamyl-tRNA(Gln) amidotransferase subunit A